MFKNDRDRQIILSVARFEQLPTAHISALHFPDAKSLTRMYAALTRLVASRYLAVIAPRPIGGNGTGSGQNVYQLGSAGWKLIGKEGRYWPFRTLNSHKLAIADAFIELKALERTGQIEIVTFESEPHSWRRVGDIELRPDLFVEIRKTWEDKIYSYWLEIDMGTERHAKITGKLIDYYNADGSLPIDSAKPFPLVIFLAPDELRARELRRWISAGREDGQDLFLVSTVSEFAGLIFS